MATPFQRSVSRVADVVVETFGCDVPDAYVQAMKSRARAPVWINLEYLSAEQWVERCHGLPSPHPPLVKYFFFPGFTSDTGGVLIERGLTHRRAAFQADKTRQVAFLSEIGLAEPEPGEHLISVFCYPQAPMAALFDALASGHAADTGNRLCGDAGGTGAGSRGAGVRRPARAPSRADRAVPDAG